MNDIKLTKEFRTQAAKAVFSIAFFGLVYILVLAGAIGLTILCAYLGLTIVIAFPRLFTVLFGIGLASLGFFILIFLLKFLFKSHKVDRSNLHEIKAEDEPELFKMIQEIVSEVKTSFPKKVYLSADVNAAVFYDSSFWSMFFPIRKNLQIGLALVNSVSALELKAILAHEFGHFSQRSMKVGSYVYNVNKVIFNMLYDNEGYQNLIQKWSNLSQYFSVSVAMAVKIIEGIQWILKKMYAVVNKSYMALSREMEFHADEIAANVAGSEPLKSSLLRLSFAEYSFDSVLSFYNKKVSSNIVSPNLFKEQHFAMNFQAAYNNFPIKGDLPEVSVAELSKFNKSKLVIKDQWSSHPSTEDRVARLNLLNIPSKHADLGPANGIFKDIERTQQSFTSTIFERVDYKGETSSHAFENFKSEYETEFFSNSFPRVYNGYYDSKQPVRFEPGEYTAVDTGITIAHLFSDRNVGLVYEAIALKNDMEDLKAISENDNEVTTFDYDGRKFNKRDIESLLSDLNLALENTNREILENDRMIYTYFKSRAETANQADRMEEISQAFYTFDKGFDDNSSIYGELAKALHFINNSTPYAQIITNFENLRPLEEKFKAQVKDLLASGVCKSELTAEMESNFEKYLSGSLTYFEGEIYLDENLNILFAAMNNYNYLLSRSYFLLKKDLLTYQAS